MVRDERTTCGAESVGRAIVAGDYLLAIEADGHAVGAALEEPARCGSGERRLAAYCGTLEVTVRDCATTPIAVALFCDPSEPGCLAPLE